MRFQHDVNDIDPMVSIRFICTWAKDISYDDKLYISHTSQLFNVQVGQMF
jgi:hypothetical protein